MIANINCMYFKESGKFYSEGTIEWVCEAIDDTARHPIVNMSKVCEKVRFLANRENKQKLPGLIGGWDGPILVNCEDGYPCLLLPEKSSGS